MNPIHGGISAKRNTHSIKHGFPYPEEISPETIQAPPKFDQKCYPIAIIERQLKRPSSECPDILVPIFNEFRIVLQRKLRSVGKKMGEELCARYLELCLKLGESPT